MDFAYFGDFLLYLWDVITVFFMNGFITIYIIAKKQFVIFLGVAAVIYLMNQENEYIVQKSGRIKKRLM